MVDPSDFRSDTVTRPTETMRRAMAEAKVGDDVFGDDPTVIALEERAAKIFGKEAALFVPSGTMANQIAVRVATRPGDEVICEASSHLFLYEVGASAMLSGVQLNPLAARRGQLTIEQVRKAIREDDVHCPRTTMLCLENTHNKAGGAVIPMETLKAFRELCNEAELTLYIDGARVFNAACALGVPVRDIASYCDMISCCLSKGLGAPVGSLLLGPRRDIDLARRVRKALGGGMRQAGVLAAPGLIALEDGPHHLEADHRRARDLARGLCGLALFSVSVDEVESNLIYATVPWGRADEVVEILENRGIRITAMGEDSVRFVLHHQLNDDDVSRAIQVATDVSNELVGSNKASSQSC